MELIQKNTIPKKLLIVFFALTATLIGLYPIIYFLIDRKFGLLGSKTNELLLNLYWNVGFYCHIIFGGISLLIGWTQFSKKLRIKRPKTHAAIGKIYIISVLLSSVGGFYIAQFATGGIIPRLGFSTLAVIWFCTTLSAYLAIKKKQIVKHQQMMAYSYAACFGAVMLRIWIPTLEAIFGEFLIAYRIVAWLSWVPNLVVARFIKKQF